MPLIAVELSVQTWKIARQSFRRPWSDAAALLDVTISGASVDPLDPRRLSTRLGWPRLRVARLLGNRPTNDAPNRPEM